MDVGCDARWRPFGSPARAATGQRPDRPPSARRLRLSWRAGVCVALLVGCGADPTSGAAPEPFWLQQDGGSSADGASRAADDVAPAIDAGAADLQDVPAAWSDASGDAAIGGDAAGAGDAGQGDTQPPAPSEQVFASWRVSRRMTQDPSPFGSAWKESRTVTLGLAKVVWTGDKGQYWHQVCAMDANEVHGSQVHFPPAFLGAIPVTPVPLTRSGAIWSQPETVELLGLKPSHVGPMPGLGEASHASAIDADKDGKPGVTVEVDVTLLGLQKIYVAQRTTSAWQGAPGEDGRIEALPTVSFEQSILGASMSLLVADTKSKPVSSGDPETLLWAPVAASTTCKTLISNASTLIGLSWPP